MEQENKVEQPPDLGISVSEKIGTAEHIGPSAAPKKTKAFNAVAVVKEDEDGTVNVLGMYYMHDDKSLVVLEEGQPEIEVRIKVGVKT